MAEVRYLLEVEKNGAIVRAFPIPLVSRYSHDLDASARLRWTLGEMPVEERSGVRQEPIRLGGSSGLRSRLGASRTGSPLFDTGPKLFKEFEAFIRDFKREAARFDGLAPGFVNPKAATNKNAESGTVITEEPTLRLIFRAVDEGHDLYVQLGQFSFDRSATQDNFTYSWSLSLTAFGVATPKRQPPVLGSLTGAYARIDKAVRVLSTAGATLDGYLDRTDAIRRQFSSPLRSVSALSTQARELAASVQVTAAWPRDLVVDALSVAGEATVAVFETWAALPLTDRLASRTAMSEAVTAIAEVRNAASEAIGAAFIRTGSPDTNGGRRFVATRGALVASYDVQPGDTLAGIAGKVTGDRGRASEIAALNGITDYATGPTGTPLRPGVSLLVPADESSGALSVDPSAVFGTDFLIGPDGDFVLDGDGADGVALVSGTANLAQGLTHRLSSRQGDSPLNPSWGLPFGPGDPITAESDALAASRFRGQVLADRRVASVQDCAISTVGDTRTGRCKAITVGGGSARLTVPIQAGA